jgi:phosphoribosylglycinamide formyltransferase-1
MKVGVLVSGRGSNLQALIDAAAAPEYPARIACVISNLPGVFALERARAAGIPALVVPHRTEAGLKNRMQFEEELIEALAGVEWVCLAGFMRVLTGHFLDHFKGRVLNIHPALLPAFPGLHGPRQALEAGVTQAGVTVHLVDSGVDTGPILAQGSVPVLEGDTEESLGARILKLEHRLYPMCLRWAVEGRVSVEGRKARVKLKEGESRWVVGEE